MDKKTFQLQRNFALLTPPPPRALSLDPAGDSVPRFPLSARYSLAMVPPPWQILDLSLVWGSAGSEAELRPRSHSDAFVLETHLVAESHFWFSIEMSAKRKPIQFQVETGISLQLHASTRKLCYRKDDRAKRPIGLHGCPEKFRESLTTPTATIPNIFHGLLFGSTL